MSIYVDENTRVIVQGITGSAGAYHARSMRDYGTKVVGGVTPGRKGTFVDEIPVLTRSARPCLKLVQTPLSSLSQRLMQRMPCLRPLMLA